MGRSRSRTRIFAFVLMPFAPTFDDLYEFGIKQPAAKLGMTAERADEQIFAEGILDRIYGQIESADIVIAELTGLNPNVFYEVGYAHGKGKLCILSTAKEEDIPFDFKHMRHIIHGGVIKTLRSRLQEELRWARDEITRRRRSNRALTPKRKDIKTTQIDSLVEIVKTQAAEMEELKELMSRLQTKKERGNGREG